MTVEHETIGRATLYHADNAVVFPLVGQVDAVITDPPYGVGFQYEGHDDTPIGYREWCEQWFAELQGICSGPIAISCGLANVTDWPKPTWILCWHKPAAMGRCSVGFNNWEPILLYGKPSGEQGADVVRAPLIPDDTLGGHPCPKPLGWASGLIHRVASKCETILDPFMGSGTTGVAAVQMGKQFIGIERERKYFEMACRRIENAQRQGDMFIGEAA